MRAEWSERALDQTREIFAYVARDRPNTATDIALGLFERAGLLAENPLQGTVWRAGTRSDIRSVLYLTYRLMYRVDRDRILVLAVRHTRRASPGSEDSASADPPEAV